MQEDLIVVQLSKTLQENPDDFLTRSALADRLEELGRSDESKYYRNLVKSNFYETLLISYLRQNGPDLVKSFLEKIDKKDFFVNLLLNMVKNV